MKWGRDSLLYIAICDDEKIVCEQLAQQIEDYCSQNSQKVFISTFLNGEDLYALLKKGQHFDLFFLDIMLYQLNGIELGKYIRENLDNQASQIIFISAQQKYAMELFALHPLDFLVKPISPLQIAACIELTKKIKERSRVCFTYQTNGIIKNIPLNDIYYFESCARKIKIFSTQGQDEFYGKLVDVYNKVKEYPFLYIHKSYLVNYSWVRCNKFSAMILENGQELPVSRSKQKTTMQRIMAISMNGIVKWH